MKPARETPHDGVYSLFTGCWYVGGLWVVDAEVREVRCPSEVWRSRSIVAWRVTRLACKGGALCL